MVARKSLSFREKQVIVISETGGDAESSVPFDHGDAEVELGNGDSLRERVEKLREEGTERLSAEEVRSELGLE